MQIKKKKRVYKSNIEDQTTNEQGFINKDFDKVI